MAGQADLLTDSPNTPTLDLLSGGVPDVCVSETPAALLVFKGHPSIRLRSWGGGRGFGRTDSSGFAGGGPFDRSGGDGFGGGGFRGRR